MRSISPRCRIVVKTFMPTIIGNRCNKRLFKNFALVLFCYNYHLICLRGRRVAVQPFTTLHITKRPLLTDWTIMSKDLFYACFYIYVCYNKKNTHLPYSVISEESSWWYLCCFKHLCIASMCVNTNVWDLEELKTFVNTGVDSPIGNY